MQHNFHQSLARSHSYENAPWWMEVYREAFPTLLSAVNVRKDGWAQRGGIDRILTLECGRTVKVDEKIRERDYGDVLLERWSDEQRREPGWIQKPLACEFIAYAIVPTRVCWLLPTLSLQRAWRLNGRNWSREFQICRARNECDGRQWTTQCVAVPVAVLFHAIADAMVIGWKAQPAPRESWAQMWARPFDFDGLKERAP